MNELYPPIVPKLNKSGASKIAFLNAAALIALLCLTVWRVVATYGVFSHTVDEPAHIAAGTQFFHKGRAEGDLTHSPLARLAVAIGPYLLSGNEKLACRIEREEQLMQCEGTRYWRTLVAARLGTLPFLVLMLTVVWAWGTRIGGHLVGFFATLVLANTPSVLAHAGLATTDLAAAATLVLALFTLVLWLEKPTLLRAAALGASFGLALGTKLSAGAFLPFASLGMVIAATIQRSLPIFSMPISRLFAQAAAAFALILIMVWAIYDFTLNPIIGANGLMVEGSGGQIGAVLRWRVYPLVEMLRGFQALAQTNQQGIPSYFMGEIRTDGWWYFFPVMFAVKTPTSILLLLACGIVFAIRSQKKNPTWLMPAVAVTVLFGVGMASHINIGMRHLLAVYPLSSLLGGIGVTALINARSRIARSAIPALLCTWLIIDVARAHPDYIPYFNDVARANAPYFSADSDLDWGQDANRLADELVRRHIQRVTVTINSTVKLAKFASIEAVELWPDQPASGWVAASIGRILDDRIQPPYQGLRWLECQSPVALIGKTILLYEIAPGFAPKASAECSWRNLAAASR